MNVHVDIACANDRRKLSSIVLDHFVADSSPVPFVIGLCVGLSIVFNLWGYEYEIKQNWIGHFLDRYSVHGSCGLVGLLVVCAGLSKHWP